MGARQHFPVFLSGESHGWLQSIGIGHNEVDTTEVTAHMHEQLPQIPERNSALCFFLIMLPSHFHTD